MVIKWSLLEHMILKNCVTFFPDGCEIITGLLAYAQTRWWYSRKNLKIATCVVWSLSLKKIFRTKTIGDAVDEYSQLRWAESQTQHSCLCLHFIRLSMLCRKPLYILTLKWLSYPCASCVTISIATLKDTQMSAHDKLMTLHYRSLEPHADRQLFTMTL